MKKCFRISLFECILISFSLCFMIFLYGPTQIYISNALDFSFNIKDIWHYMLPLSVVSTAIGTFILTGIFRMNSKAGMFLAIICTGMLLAFFIEGNYLAAELPILDGNEIDWKDYNRSKTLSYVVWCICAFGSTICIIKIKQERIIKAVKWINTIVLLFMVITLFISCVTNKNTLNEKSDATLTADGMLEMSKENNFVIFLLDSIDARSFENMLDKNPEYKEVFSGFTSFTNTLCMYPFTDRSVPYILFGKINDNSSYFPDYLEEAINDSPFFEVLSKEGYDQRVYTDLLQGINISKRKFGNFVTAEEFKNRALFCKMLLKITGFRYLPFDLKRFCVLTPENIYHDSLKTTESDSLDLYSFNNADLYKRIQDGEIIYNKKKCFRFIYAWGAHAPYIYDKNLNEISNATYEEAIECSVRLIDVYFEKLKNSGVFDNSVIIVLADHGINTANYLGREGRQNPIMLIKGIGEQHEYRRNDAPVSHADLQTAYKKLLEGKNSSEIFEWEEGDTRKRTFMLSDSGVLTEMIQFETYGHASDTVSMCSTGNVFPYIGDLGVK